MDSTTWSWLNMKPSQVLNEDLVPTAKSSISKQKSNSNHLNGAKMCLFSMKHVEKVKKQEVQVRNDIENSQSIFIKILNSPQKKKKKKKIHNAKLQA